MRRRFFVEKFGSTTAVLEGEAAGHLARVLRAEPGNLYELSDGQKVWLARIERVRKADGGPSIQFALVEPMESRESLLPIQLLISIVKFDRFEWCLEKAVELGASEIIPLAAARSEKRLIAAAQKRSSRWVKILLESAQQARRLRPPGLCPVQRPEAAFANSSAPCKLLLSERNDAQPFHSLAAVLDKSSVALATGPEGGWTDVEIHAACAAGFRDISLGENILRTETAVIAGLAIVRYVCGE